MRHQIVLVTDDNYAPYSACLLLSLFESNRNLTFSVYMITCSLSVSNQHILSEICESHGSELIIKSINENELDKYDKIGEWSKYTFMKLMIPDLIPATLKTILYLDVDMLVVGSIEGLLKEDIDDYALAGVEDCSDCIFHKSRCGIPENSPYINSGVMLVNLEKWKEAKNDNLFNRFVDSNRSQFSINDQDVINAVFQNRIKTLHLKYNLTNHCYGFHYSIMPGQKKQWKEARKSPIIVHFTNWNKPWKYECVHEYKKIYLKTLSKTPYMVTYDSCSERQKILNLIKHTIVSLIDVFRLL